MKKGNMTSQKIIDRTIEVRDPNGIRQGLETLKVRLWIRGNILMIKFKSPHTRLLNVEVSTRKAWIKIYDFPKLGSTAILDGFLCEIEGDKGGQER